MQTILLVLDRVVSHRMSYGGHMYFLHDSMTPCKPTVRAIEVVSQI